LQSSFLLLCLFVLLSFAISSRCLTILFSSSYFLFSF
jgi:hypothetical protein